MTCDCNLLILGYFWYVLVSIYAKVSFLEFFIIPESKKGSWVVEHLFLFQTGFEQVSERK